MMQEMRNEMIALVEDALAQLAVARREIMQETTPPTPMPRFRHFRLTGSGWYVEYPPVDERGQMLLDTIRVVRGSQTESISIYGSPPAKVNRFVSLVGYSPTNIVRLVQWLHAIERWMRARAEGRRRHAQEILKQQQRAVDEMDRMITAIKLKRSV